MKYLTLDYIKAHSRIEYDCENELLDLYGEAAEDAVLKILNRDMLDLRSEYGDKVPAAIIQATLIIVDNSYLNRTPASVQSLSAVPYGVDFLLKPYMKL